MGLLAEGKIVVYATSASSNALNDDICLARIFHEFEIRVREGKLDLLTRCVLPLPDLEDCRHVFRPALEYEGILPDWDFRDKVEIKIEPVLYRYLLEAFRHDKGDILCEEGRVVEKGDGRRGIATKRRVSDHDNALVARKGDGEKVGFEHSRAFGLDVISDAAARELQIKRSGARARLDELVVVKSDTLAQ